MVGGGQGAFIGNIHRIAMRITDHYELLAGCLSSDPKRNRSSGLDIGLASDRVYSDYKDMAKAESQRKDGIQAIVIVTPNYLHFEVAQTFLQHGIHVICDKPICMSSEESLQLLRLSQQVQKLVFVTYNYTAYPMVREARERVLRGDLGPLRFLKVEYTQDWLATDIEQQGHKQASWRVNPELAGIAGCIGDIGVHAYNLAHFMTGKIPSMLAADLVNFIDGRILDDHAHVLLRYSSGARGILIVSQVAIGSENRLSIQIVGERGALEWQQQQPDQLHYHAHGEATQILSRARHQSSPETSAISLLPAGHPEGFLEAFALLYREIATCLLDGQLVDTLPMIHSAISDMEFIEACVKSSQNNATWIWY
jgi:predicted dehydrogenase